MTGAPVTVGTNVAVTGTVGGPVRRGGQRQRGLHPRGAGVARVRGPRTAPAASVIGERRNFHHPMFSPDGRRLLARLHLHRGPQRLGPRRWRRAPSPGPASTATGTTPPGPPDGRFITYIAPINRADGVTLLLLRKPPASAEPPDTLLVSRSLSYTGVWLRDGSALVTTATDLRRARRPIPPRQTREPTPRSCATPARARSSPWSPARSRSSTSAPRPTAAGSRSSRTSRAATRSTCATSRASSDQVLVSLEGGNEPVWSPDGRELFYRETKQSDPYLVAAGIRTTPTLR